MSLWYLLVVLFVVGASISVVFAFRGELPERTVSVWGSAAAFAVLLVVALRDIVDVPWFEDDAMITFAYSKNLGEGCGWNFNCEGDDFATSSYLQALIGAAWFVVADTARALHLEKLWENFLVIWGSAFFFVSSVRLGASRVAALVSIALIVLVENSFLYLFSGMENALGFFVLAGLMLAYSYDRLIVAGALVGVAALVRPEYALAGAVLAGVDLFGTGRPLDVPAWLRRWSTAALAAVAAFAPVFVFVWTQNGTPFADTLEIKRLTASNWGALYHEELWPLAQTVGLALVVLALGLIGLVFQRSALLFWPLFATVISVVYARLGLPRSPWYYMPFWSGLAACALGFPFFYRWLKRAWGLNQRLASSWTRRFVAAFSAAVFVVAAFGSPLDTGRANVDLASRIAAKRTSVNTATGLYLRNASDAEDRVAVPNIGYIGFYSERFIVDLVGLVTPEASLSLSRDGWREFDPRFYVDKAVIGERLLELEGYTFRRVTGGRQHRAERFMVLERYEDVNEGDSVALKLAPSEASDLGPEWEWKVRPDMSGRRVSDAGEQVYASVSDSDAICGADGVEVALIAGEEVIRVPEYYVNRLGFGVIDTYRIGDFDFGGLSAVRVRCRGGGEPAGSAPTVHLAISTDAQPS